MASTSISVEKNFFDVRCEHTCGWHTVREAARLGSMQLQSGLVRQHERGALHAMDPRLYMCAVPFVARGERRCPLTI